MSQFQTLKTQAQLVMTYLLTLVDGTQYTLIPVDPHGTVMDMPDGEDTWYGRSITGDQVAVPSGQVLMVEEDRYRVTRFNGQTSRSERVSEEKLEQIIEKNTDPETGEVKNLRSIQDVEDPENGVDRYQKRF